MQAVIMAGGLGTRLSEGTHMRPKPMVVIGLPPILGHIKKIYSHDGISDFVICCGYKGYVIKEYFATCILHSADVWTVPLVDTGDNTMTGGRLKRGAKYLNDDDFYFTCGDGVSDVSIQKLVDFHQNKRLATVIAVQPPGRFGSLQIEKDKVAAFVVLDPKVVKGKSRMEMLVTL